MFRKNGKTCCVRSGLSQKAGLLTLQVGSMAMSWEMKRTHGPKAYSSSESDSSESSEESRRKKSKKKKSKRGWAESKRDDRYPHKWSMSVKKKALNNNWEIEQEVMAQRWSADNWDPDMKRPPITE